MRGSPKMLDGKKLFIIIAVLAFLCVPAGFPAASVNNAPTSSKRVLHTKSKAAHPQKGGRHSKGQKQAKAGKHKIIGKEKKASTEGEQIGVFTAYTGMAGKKRSPHMTSDGTY